MMNDFFLFENWAFSHNRNRSVCRQQEVKPNANGTGNPADVICKGGVHEQNGRTTREMYKINCNFINNS